MNYIEELESKFHPNFIAMEVNTESKRYTPISYMKMLEEMLWDLGYDVIGSKLTKQNNPVATITRRYDFKLEAPSILAQDAWGRWFKWVIYNEIECGYCVSYLGAITIITFKSLYTEATPNGIVTKTNTIINVPISNMRFTLTFLIGSNNVNNKLSKKAEIAIRNNMGE